LGYSSGLLTWIISWNWEAWWKYTHNIHHVATNSLEYDPDIQHLPIIAITEKYFNNIKSMFHNKILPFDAFGKFFVPMQHHLYYPIMGVSRFNLYAQSILLHFRDEVIPFRVLDLLSIIFYWSWHIALLSQLSSFSRVFIYVFFSHFFGPGLLAIQITISHFAMPVYEDIADENKDYKFLEIQFEHSMDVDCHPWLDWLHGGLQFQAVHHLLPRIPRHNLRIVRDQYIMPFAEKWNFKYNSHSFYKSNLLVLETLSGAAQKARNFPRENLGHSQK